jgi:hypothetical protein
VDDGRQPRQTLGLHSFYFLGALSHFALERVHAHLCAFQTAIQVTDTAFLGPHGRLQLLYPFITHRLAPAPEIPNLQQPF